VGIPFAFGVAFGRAFENRQLRNAALFISPIGNRMLKFEINLLLVVVCPVWVVTLPQETNQSFLLILREGQQSITNDK
jgi:hypothetical protein